MKRVSCRVTAVLYRARRREDNVDRSALQSDYLDPDGDGISTTTEKEDTLICGADNDSDDVPGWLDTDSDGDGVPDNDGDDDLIPGYLDPTEPGA